jgi:hypothetical protein
MMRKNLANTHTHTHTHMHIYIYIYISTCIHRREGGGRELAHTCVANALLMCC